MTSETKRDKNADAAGNKVDPFVCFFEECKRVVRFLYDLLFPWTF